MIFRPSENNVELECYSVVQSLREINSAEGSFKCCCEIWIWLWLSEEEYLERKKNPNDWKCLVAPYPRAYNGIETNILPILGANGLNHHTRLTKEGHCKVLIGWDLTSVFSSKFHLESFPMDSQELVADIMFNNYTDCEDFQYNFNFKWIDPRFGKFFHFSDPVWTLDRNHIKRANHSDSRHYEMRIYLRRNEKYYLLRICLLQGFIAGLSILIFFFGPDAFSSHLNQIMCGILATISFLFVIQGDLPKLPYITLLDEYIFGCFFFYLILTFASLICSFSFKWSDLLSWFWFPFVSNSSLEDSVQCTTNNNNNNTNNTTKQTTTNNTSTSIMMISFLENIKIETIMLFFSFLCFFFMHLFLYLRSQQARKKSDFWLQNQLKSQEIVEKQIKNLTFSENNYKILPNQYTTTNTPSTTSTPSTTCTASSTHTASTSSS